MNPQSDPSGEMEDNRSNRSQLDNDQMSLVQFALAEAGRSIAHQQSELDRLRERATAQLGYTTAIGTFVLGTLLSAEPDRGTAFYLLMVVASLFALNALALAYLVWRKVENWRIKVGASFIVDGYANDPSFDSLSELAGYYDGAREKNETLLQTKRDQFRNSTVADGVLLVWLVGSLWILV